ncbi:MAG: hypothetical protein MRY83_20075 [Flavobacteriales bacterium]|nr:hypothetical protein [Flavobacteriales bacterium]
MKYAIILILGVTLFSCTKKEYDKYDNAEVICNTFTGNIDITSGGSDPGADFTGNGDSGEYCFVWDNKQKKASANFDITTPTGSVQLIMEDALGTEVLNKTRSAGGNDSYSGVSNKGEPGKWMIKFIFTDFDGDGSYSFHPGD